MDFDGMKDIDKFQKCVKCHIVLTNQKKDKIPNKFLHYYIIYKMKNI